LEETVTLRKEALIVLAKANRLTKHLTGYQRLKSGLSYNLGEIKARIDKIHQHSPVLFHGQNSIEEGEALINDCESQNDFRSRRELKQKVLALLALIDGVKEKLLRLDLLEFRCRELILSINKALEAFRYESRIISRKIYPFGFFSLCYRALRRLCGGAYFNFRDLGNVTALGNITGHILKIADSPII
jgi:hypothetical protein